MADYVYWKLSCSNVREIQIIRSGQEIQKNNNKLYNLSDYRDYYITSNTYNVNGNKNDLVNYIRGFLIRRNNNNNINVTKIKINCNPYRVIDTLGGIPTENQNYNGLFILDKPSEYIDIIDEIYNLCNTLKLVYELEITVIFHTFINLFNQQYYYMDMNKQCVEKLKYKSKHSCKYYLKLFHSLKQPKENYYEIIREHIINKTFNNFIVSELKSKYCNTDLFEYFSNIYQKYILKFNLYSPFTAKKCNNKESQKTKLILKYMKNDHNELPIEKYTLIYDDLTKFVKTNLKFKYENERRYLNNAYIINNYDINNLSIINYKKFIAKIIINQLNKFTPLPEISKIGSLPEFYCGPYLYKNMNNITYKKVYKKINLSQEIIKKMIDDKYFYDDYSEPDDRIINIFKFKLNNNKRNKFLVKLIYGVINNNAISYELICILSHYLLSFYY